MLSQGGVGGGDVFQHGAREELRVVIGHENLVPESVEEERRERHLVELELAAGRVDATGEQVDDGRRIVRIHDGESDEGPRCDVEVQFAKAAVRHRPEPDRPPTGGRFGLTVRHCELALHQCHDAAR